jgi:ABC-type Fe3+ transport system substrate-binding protein
MRRYTSLILFFIVLIAPFIVRGVMNAGNARKPGDAIAAGKAVELTIVTPHNEDIRRVFAAAFSDFHSRTYGRPVKVTYLTPGGTNDIVRLINDKYDAQRKDKRSENPLPPEDKTLVDIDMMWGGGDFPFEVELKPRGVLKPVDLPPGLLAASFPVGDIAGVRLYEAPSKDAPDQQPRWVGVALSGFGIIYSPTLYDRLGMAAPTKWSDLADPRLAGLIAGTDPARSASVANAYLTILQRAMVDAEEALFAQRPELKALSKAQREKNTDYVAAIDAGFKTGMGTLQLMAANARYFTDSGSQPCNDVGNGEAAAGVAIDFYARVNEETLGPQRITYVPPKSASAINADPIAILYGVRDEPEAQRGPRLTTANRFVAWLLSPEAQQLWALKAGHSPYLHRALRRLPVVQSVYTDRTNWADDINPYADAGGFNLRPEWNSQLFSSLRMIWSASWIDARSTLKQAYESILSVPDPARRAELIAELATVPLERKDVLDQRARDRAINAGTDPNEKDVRVWRAKQRIMWARKFRDHYQAVAARAGQAAVATKD